MCYCGSVSDNLGPSALTNLIDYCSFAFTFPSGPFSPHNLWSGDPVQLAGWSGNWDGAPAEIKFGAPQMQK